MPSITQPYDLLERSQIFQERLMSIDSLHQLTSLASTVLDASLYVCDRRGFILASSARDERSCPAFAHAVESRQVSREALRTMLGDRPLCNVIRDPKCPGAPCTRLTFPIGIGEEALPGALTFFIWDRTVTQEDQALASLIAGAFSVWMRKDSGLAVTAKTQKISLLRELLDYRPGLKSYYERSLSTAQLHNLPGLFRLVYIQHAEHPAVSVDTMVMELQYQFPAAWIFAHKDCLLMVFNDAQLSVQSAASQLEGYLLGRDLTACISAEFKDLLALRYMFEDTKVACRIAVRKQPDARLHRAERYLDLAFLHRCRQYFPLEEYYLEGFMRLHDYDEANDRNYLATLTAYLDNNMNVSAAAKAIFMHRNTMTQQLEKIEELLGVSLRDKDICWYLQLCLRIHELLDM